jgi:hypothetical protein
MLRALARRRALSVVGETRMLKRFVAVLAAPALAVALMSSAWAQDPPDEIPGDYLVGTWAVGDTGCGAEATEHMTFDASGTFGTAQGGKPTAVGFWHQTDDRLDLHMVSSPAFFDDALGPYTGQYTYYYAQALLFDVEDGAFRMVASMAGQLRGADLTRCP